MRKILRAVPLLSDFFRFSRALFRICKFPTKTPLGFYFNGNNEQVLNLYEIQISDYLRANASRFSQVINVGANSGYWPLFLRGIAFDNNIIAIEPDYFNYMQMRMNFCFNRSIRIHTIRKAVSSRFTKIDLYGFGTGISSIEGWGGDLSKRRTSIECVKLDDISTLNNSLLIIDVEGAELDTLRSAEKLLTLNTEFIVEIALNEHSPAGKTSNIEFEDVFEFMISYGYQTYTWLPNFIPIDLFIINKIKNGSLKPEIHMYVFRKN